MMKNENLEMEILDLLEGIVEEFVVDKDDLLCLAEESRNINLDKEIDHVVFNNPATVVFWKDGTKTVTKCHKSDVFNKETGLAMCIIRKLCNNRHYNTVFEKYCR